MEYYLGNTKARIENIDLHFPCLVRSANFRLAYGIFVLVSHYIGRGGPVAGSTMNKLCHSFIPSGFNTAMS